MSQTNVVQSGGLLSLPSLLGIVFIILKLTGVITWSWVWVLAPFWIPLALTLVIFVPIAAVIAIVGSKR